ncbi:avidin/streptavidin family protein [Acinetobacter baumannii]|nr:avidin/streptavidin family protein [Acinetobacter baumannii]MDX7906782.1 avidin/streptavidin family protein [Acinetobacter baumannii]MDX7925360.1 avidin/streptavidin family protein [Acinetobacter baumannii]
MSLLENFARKKSPTGGAEEINFLGEWVNELGSTLIIKSANNQQITGEYKTAKGAPTPTESFPLVGFISGDLISFTVNFGIYGSLTSWVGQHTIEKAKEVIKSTWVLAKNIKDEDEDKNIWGSVLTGSNSFTRK